LRGADASLYFDFVLPKIGFFWRIYSGDEDGFCKTNIDYERRIIILKNEN